MSARIAVALLPDDDARCQIIVDGKRCERYSIGAKMTGRMGTGTLLTVKLCSDHATQVASSIDPRLIVTSEQERSS